MSHHHQCDKKCRDYGCRYQKDCHKKKKCHKKCSSSSSSEECCDIVTPKVVYSACINHGTATLLLTAVVESPNLDTPPTFTCPGAIGKQIIIRYTITNTGNTSIKSPRFVYDSLTGLHKAGKCKLAAGQSDTVTAKHCITKCECAGGNINISANAYVQFSKKCVVLVSQPIAIQITKTA
jgi:hypothetical protein